MKILLVNPFTSTESTAGSYSRFLAPMPPISLAVVAATLRKARHEVHFYDDYTHGGDRRSLLGKIESIHLEAIGLTCVTPTAPRTLDIARLVREKHPRMKIILGNIHASIFYEQLLNADLADYIVLGEGDETAPELLTALDDRTPLRNVKGIAYKADGKVIATEPRPYLRDLDALPFPLWEIFPLGRYRLFNFAVVRKPGMLVLGSRGCPYNCSFCSLKIMGTRHRSRSAASIAEEFIWLNNKFGYRQGAFIDPMFPFSKKEGMEFSAELINRGIHKRMVWTTETRVDHVDQELLHAMRASGLRRIMYGFEAGTQASIDSIKKNFTVDQARKAVEMTKKARIGIIGFFMLGVPGDTVESINETIRYSISLGIDFAKYTVFSPFPGTRVYEDMLASGEIPDTDDWAQFTNYPNNERPAIYLPKGVTNNDIMRLQRRAFLKFYLRPSTILNQLFRIRTLGISDMINGLRLLLGL